MTMEKRESLLGADFRDFSTAMFGSVFDVNLLALSSGKKVTMRMLDRALRITIKDPRTNGIGVAPVLTAATNHEWAERCLSRHAQTALGRYVHKQAVPRSVR